MTANTDRQEPLRVLREMCSLGVGCESGVCYAAAHGDPSQCGRAPAGQAVTEDVGVPVERVRALAEKWRAEARRLPMEQEVALNDCADELDALAQEGT